MIFLKQLVVILVLSASLFVPAFVSAQTCDIQCQITAIQDRILALQQQLVALQQQSGQGLQDGDRVQTSVRLNVRSAPSTNATIITKVPAGSIGTITCSGQGTCPTTANGYRWWYIKWDSSVTGWSAEGSSEASFLQSVANASSTLTVVSAAGTGSISISSIYPTVLYQYSPYIIYIFGSGFTPEGNQIKIDGVKSGPDIDSAGGALIIFKFIQPDYLTPGTHTLSVTNVNGTSNVMNLTFKCAPDVGGLQYACGAGGISTTGTGSVFVTAINPISGPIGTRVIITGSGFTSTSNKVKFGNLGSENNPSYNLNSSDGRTLVFTVPASNYMACWSTTPRCLTPVQQTQPGTYAVSVINANGTSNAMTFTVTSGTVGTLDASCSVTPTSAIIGQTVTWSATPSGGTGSYTYSWSGTGNLTGNLLGTNKTVQRAYSGAGIKTASVTVTSGSQSVTRACSNSVTITAADPLAPVITTTSLPRAYRGTPYSTTVSASGGTGSYTWSLASGALPPGMTLTNAVCVAAPCQTPATISGTPTGISGVFSFYLKVSAGGVSSASRYFEIITEASPASIPDPLTVPFQISAISVGSGYLSFSGNINVYINADNFITILGARIQKGVVLDFYKSDGITKTGTVSGFPAGLDQSCGGNISGNMSQESASGWWPCQKSAVLSLGNDPAAIGTYLMRARNPDGSVSNFVTVNIQAGDVAVAGVSLNGIPSADTKAIGGKTYTVEVYGSNFQSGATVTIDNAFFAMFFGNPYSVTLNTQLINVSTLTFTWTAPTGIDINTSQFQVSVKNPGGGISRNQGFIPFVLSAASVDNPQFSVTPIKGRVGTAFSFCSNVLAPEATKLVMEAQNGIKMVLQAQRVGDCLNFTVGSTVSATPGFVSSFGSSDPYHPASFNVVPGFYHFRTVWREDDSIPRQNGGTGQEWTIEITSI